MKLASVSEAFCYIKIMTEIFKPFAASLLFLIKDGSVLLIRRFNTGWNDGFYTVPSGHVDSGEPPSRAAARETLEEVGVVVEESDLTPIHINYRKSTEDERVYVDFYFIADKWTGEPANNEPQKCDDVAWFKLNQLPENTVEIVRNALINYQKGRHYSEMGW